MADPAQGGYFSKIRASGSLYFECASLIVYEIDSGSRDLAWALGFFFSSRNDGSS